MNQSPAPPAADAVSAAQSPDTRRSGCRLFLIVFAAVVAALLIAAIVIKLYVFPDQLQPVELREREKQELNQKLQRLGYQDQAFVVPAEGGRLRPRAYSEAGASREVRFSERELNGLLAKNTDLARKLAIDLADNLASARLVVPLDPDLPLLGGQTLRMSAGLEVDFAANRPVIRLRGVSAWGVPLPNAWLGNLKHVDLVDRYGEQGGFWQSFAAGIETIEVRDGELLVRLRP